MRDFKSCNDHIQTTAETIAESEGMSVHTTVSQLSTRHRVSLPANVRHVYHQLRMHVLEAKMHMVRVAGELLDVPPKQATDTVPSKQPSTNDDNLRIGDSSRECQSSRNTCYSFSTASVWLLRETHEPNLPRYSILPLHLQRLPQPTTCRTEPHSLSISTNHNINIPPPSPQLWG